MKHKSRNCNLGAYPFSWRQKNTLLGSNIRGKSFMRIVVLSGNTGCLASLGKLRCSGKNHYLRERFSPYSDPSNILLLLCLQMAIWRRANKFACNILHEAFIIVASSCKVCVRMLFCLSYSPKTLFLCLIFCTNSNLQKNEKSYRIKINIQYAHRI